MQKNSATTSDEKPLRYYLLASLIFIIPLYIVVAIIQYWATSDERAVNRYLDELNMYAGNDLSEVQEQVISRSALIDFYSNHYGKSNANSLSPEKIQLAKDKEGYKKLFDNYLELIYKYNKKLNEIQEKMKEEHLICERCKEAPNLQYYDSVINPYGNKGMGQKESILITVKEKYGS